MSGHLSRSGRGSWRQVIAVFVDVRMDDAAPAVGGEGVDVFVFGKRNGLQESLAEIGEGSRGFGLELTAGGGSENAAKSEAEIAGGEIVAGEEKADVAANFFGGLGLRFLAGVEATEKWVAGFSRHAATAAVGEGESTVGRAIFGMSGRHEILLFE